MNSNSALRRTLGVFALALTSWTILATSQVHLSLLSGTVRVQSDCPGAPGVTEVTVSSYQVTAPVGLTFQDFGFPTTFVDGTPNTGTVGAARRNCRRTIGNDTVSDDWVYTCFDDGQFVCNVHMVSVH